MPQRIILLYGDAYNERVSQGIDYFSFLSPYGAVLLITPQTISDDILALGDILALPGGADVDPRRYGHRPHWRTGRVNPQYEEMDTLFLPKWIETGKPIIGICRGAQTLNVALGGTLIQDVAGHVGGADRTAGEHEIYTDIKLDLPVYTNNGESGDYRVYETNSYHHQAIGKLGEGLEVLGFSAIYKNCPSVTPRPHPDLYIGSCNWEKTKQGIVPSKKNYYAVPEIVKHMDKPYIAFQYHPENMNCPLAHHLINQTLSEYYAENH